MGLAAVGKVGRGCGSVVFLFLFGSLFSVIIFPISISPNVEQRLNRSTFALALLLFLVWWRRKFLQTLFAHSAPSYEIKNILDINHFWTEFIIIYINSTQQQ